MKAHNFAPLMFLTELEIQCNFAKELYKRLLDAATDWCSEPLSSKAMAPRDIMINCTAFLSAASVISKILFTGSSRRGNQGLVNKRRKKMRELLGIDGHKNFPTLKNLAVRNDFEHIDERLDEKFSKFQKGRVTQISVSKRKPHKDTLVLKRFDPIRLTISFAEDEISLNDCMKEIEKIYSQVKPAYSKLDGPKYGLY